MGLVLKVPVDADSAFAHKLVSLIDEIVKGDKGLIPDKESASWYEHLVSCDVDGKVNAEAFVLVITPTELHEEGQEKWNAISGSVRDALNDGEETRTLMRGWAMGYPNHSEQNITFPSLDETVPKDRTSQPQERR